MSSQRRVRDLYLFFGGVILGIIGNMLVGYWIAWNYPMGIPRDAAHVGTIGTIILFFAYLVLFIYLSR